MVQLQVDGRPIRAMPGENVVQVLRRAGIALPSLCYHPDLSVVGSCRACLVEMDGVPDPVPACTLLAAEGMMLRTDTPELHEARRSVLELLYARYDAENADDAENELLYWVRRYGVQRRRREAAPPRYPRDADPNPFLRVDMNRCILCTRCVRACAEIQGRFVWGVAGRGAQTRIVAGLDTHLLEARCESCGACADYCPTGALHDRWSFGQPPAERRVTTTCGYCGVGCQFDLHVRGDRVVGVGSQPAAVVNGRSLCVKGRYGVDFLHHPDRLTHPRVRAYLLENRPRPPGNDRGPWVAVDWDTALRVVVQRLAQVLRSEGPRAIGLLSSAKCTNEENYLMQKLARQVLGTHNVDHCARLCHASTVAGLRMALGSGAMSNSMHDIAQQAAAALVIGSNTTEQHPVFGAMLRQAVHQRGMQLVVADPRAIDLTEFAAIHLRHRPGTDIALLNSLMHVILENRWEDRDFIQQRCENFDALQDSLARYAPETVAAITGVPAADLRRAAEILARHKPMAAIWAMGITQHTTGVMNVLALANLQLLLGNLGQPGGGVNPLRGQNNVQGACDMGALPNVFPGYQDVADAAAVARFGSAWALSGEAPHPDGLLLQTGSPGDRLPPSGLTVTEMIAAAGRGALRALYILGEDPALTDPNSNQVRAHLAAAPFIVLQEIFPSETSAFADVLLPGAAFAEKEGTFTNTERRIQRVRQAIDPPGEARPDWQIVAEVARRLLAALGRHPQGPLADWNYRGPAHIMQEIAALTPSYAGVSYARLDAGESLQWPVLDQQHPGTPVLHSHSFPRGRGRFHVVEHLPPCELPDEEFPLLLTTGRLLYHWHGGELSRRAAVLTQLCPMPYLEIHPVDARQLGISHGQWLRVVSRRGAMRALAAVTHRVAEGIVFGNFHFPPQYNVNALTIDALDPVAKIPEYKVCAVRVEPDDDGAAAAEGLA
jgi:formate dehydrogenase alpha subunit